MKRLEKVFEPVKIGRLDVKNRIEFPPVIPCLASPDGYITRELITFFKSIARGGAGIVTIGDSAIDNEYSRTHEAQLIVDHDRMIPGLSDLADAIKRYGSKASIELNHGGRCARPECLNGKNPIAPSPIPTKQAEMFAAMEGGNMIQIEEMNQDLIEQVVDNFADAAYRCMLSGFDMVLIHGGHGQLLAQFLSPYTNKRKDAYGGNLENRARFPIQVLDRIRSKVGNNLAIEYRMSIGELVPDSQTEEEAIAFAKLIEDKVDCIQASAGLLTDPETIPHMIQPTYFPHGYNVHRAEKLKKAVQIPVTCLGSILDLEMADKIIADGKADVVVMGRALIADPDLPRKTFHGRIEDVRPCVRCNSCTHRVSHFYPIRCAVNPIIGREVEFDHILPTGIKKKVLVVGGGPGGMEAAQVASSRGHQVTLYEKEENLGGALSVATAPPFKKDMKRYLEWMIQQTHKAPGVKIKSGTEATADTIKTEKPHVLILAVGATPQTPKITGATGSNVVSASEVLAGEVEVAEKVIVVGAGMTGCETSLLLAQQGKKVMIIDMLGELEIAQDVPILNRIGLMGLLHKHGVDIRTELKLEEITDKGVIVIHKDKRRHELTADTVVLSLGYKPRSETVKTLQGLAPEVYIIGDCSNPRNLMAAIHDGFNVAVEL